MNSSRLCWPFSYFTKPSREHVYSSAFEWTCPEKGVYYLVVKASYGNARVKLRAETSQRPLTNDFPRGITDKGAWCIWIVNAWVAKNINYVRDPNFELVQRAEETLKLRAETGIQDLLTSFADQAPANQMTALHHHRRFGRQSRLLFKAS